MSSHAEGSERPPFTVALVHAEETDLTDAQAILIDRLGTEPGIELVGKLVGHRAAPDVGPSFAVRWALACERLLMRRRITPYDTGPATRSLADLPVIGAAAAPSTFDVALALGDSALELGKLSLARYGELSVSYAGARGPDWIGASRSVFDCANIKVDVLLRRSENPDRSVVRRTAYNPKPGAVLTGAFVAEKVVLLLLRVLKDMQATKAGVTRLVEPLPTLEPPGSADLFPYLRKFYQAAYTRLTERILERRNRARQVWRVISGKADLYSLNPREAWDLPANAPFMADPFLFDHDGSTWIFYEAMNTDGRNGWIEVARLTEDSMSSSVVALKRAYHLSFPFVFREGNDIFMIPETQQQRRLEIWRAKTFPTEWVLHKTAFEGQYLAESSLFRADDGQYWLLTNLSDHFAFQDHSSELYLFAVDGPDLNTIVPHPDNPVVIGSDIARNAGALIRQGGRVYRPSQNNSFGVYGYGLNIMEVTRLDPTGYEERLVRSFTPEDKPGSTGLHHLSILGDRFVIDWCAETRKG